MKSFSEFLEQKIHNKGFKEGLQNPPTAGRQVPNAPTAGRQVPNAPTAGRQVPNADNSYSVFYHNLISPPGNMDPAKAIELAVRKFPKDEKEIRDNFAGMKSIEKYPDGHDNYGSYFQGLTDHGMTPEKAIELVVQKFPSDEKEIRDNFAGMKSIEKYPDGHDNYGSYYQGLIDHGMTPEKAIELVVKKFPSDEQELRSKFAAMNARKNIKRV